MYLREIFHCLAIAVFITPSYGQTFTSDPCIASQYKTLNEPHRSTGFLNEAPLAPLCDDLLRRGWYRFTSLAGGDMPTTCQETNRCGTTKPIWVEGSNPTFEDGIVMRHICVNMNSSNPQDKYCCEYSEDIFMKNCGNFFVYYLYPTIDCDMAYCAGSLPPCPVGKWSNNSFPPCKDNFPVMEAPPIVTGPEKQGNNSFGFQCTVIFNNDDPDPIFEVIWTFNGLTDPLISPQLLNGHQRTATLDVSLLTRQIDTNVACQVRSYYAGREADRSGFLTSNVTYFGMQSPPVLSDPILQDNRSFIFQCNVNDNFSIPGQAIEVVWIFDGQQDASLPSQIISGANQSAVLDGVYLKGHLNTQLGCQARVVFPGTAAKSKFINSNTYYVGMKVSPNPLEMSELDFEKYVTVSSTIPIVCELDLDCCLTLKSNVNKTSAVSFMNTCEHRICSSDWDPHTNTASVKIGVVPTRNILVAGSRDMRLSLEIALPSGSESYLNIFEGYKLSQIQITVKDESAFQCSLTGDPHIMGFDFPFMYDLYKSGDFVAYVAPNRDFMIQVRTVPCGGGSVACICGIVVRERNDVIKISQCDNGQSSIDIAYKLSPGAVVQRSSDGYRYGIYLPSGSEVKIESGATNVYISIPAFDKGRGRGLCGTNDGNKDNDFTHPDGHVDPPCTQRCIPNAFLESWRVSGNGSLFEVVPEPSNTTDEDYGPSTTYCSCNESPNGNSSISCSERQHIQIANTACPNCPVITNLLTPSYIAGVGWVKPGTDKPDPPFVHPEIKPVDPNKQWPNDQGVTEAQAQGICSQAIQRSQLYPQCQKFEQIRNSVISDCLADILYGGTTAFLDDVTSSFTSQCQLQLAADPGSYVTNGDGHQVIKPELTDICPTECLRHGQCGEKGRCICQDGWEGETCLIDSMKGPQLVEIKGGAVCDATQRPCDTINIDVANINFLHTLMYRVQAMDEQGNSVGDPRLATATFLTPTTITCKLPSLGPSTQLYNISATKDGNLFGNVLTFRVFDGTCLDCDLATCREKSTACHIANVCYKNGEADQNNRNKTCDITKSTTKWTTLRSDQDRFPLLDTVPEFTGPNFGANGTIDFQCVVIYDGTDPEQAFEVVWTFNGRPHPSIPSQLLLGQERIARLDINLLQGQVDTHLGCQVRSYYTGSEISKSEFFVSNTSYFGIQTPPVLTGPISVDNSSFVFQCQILSNTQISSQEIEVAWTFNGQQDLTLPTETLDEHNKTVELNGSLLMGHLGTQVGCQARLVYPGSDVKTRFIGSNTYFAGIKITPDPLEISEIDFEKYMTVTSTIPILCDHDLECCLTFKLNVNKTAAVSLMNSCEYKMCSTSWNPYLKRASIEIGVVPTRNILLQGSRNVLLALDVIPSPDSGVYLQAFENYQPTPLQITIKDETAYRCSMTGDPHIMGFDFRFMYDLYKSGDFVAYVAPDRDFMIQVRTVPCGGGSVACICGIVVRERNDVIKINNCGNPNSGPIVDIAYQLSPGAIIQRSSDGNRFGIYLPSGSELKIESGVMNIYISIPAFDKGRGRGICGTNDGVEDNDFTRPDGTVDPACKERCIPDAFLESWRVTGNYSLFEVVPDPVNTTEPIFGSSSQYCSCLGSANGSSTVSCSNREHVQSANTACPNCPVITGILTPSYVVGVGWVRPGTNKPDPPFVHPEITQVVDPNKQWPNDQGVTEAQARDICSKAIERSPLYTQCQNFQRLIDSVTSDCLADILHGGTTAFLDDITSSFTSQCQLTLAQNPDSYVTNTDGQQVINPDLIDICPVGCLKHGRCEGKRECICQKGWEGETCLIETGKGPQLIEIRGGELCDVTQRRCDVIHIDVTNIIFTNPLTCKVQKVDDQNNSVGSPILRPATFLTPSTISCTLPSLEESTQRYNISATKDGQVFGNELPLRVFDSTCLDCDILGCEVKNTACRIKNICYKNGEVDRFNENRTCDITKSTSAWTTKRDEQSRTPVLDVPPIFSGPHIHTNGSNFFQCEVSDDLYDPEQVFEVTWTFNGQPHASVSSHVLTGHDRLATLDIALLQGHVDKYIGCQIKTYYIGYESSPSRYLASNVTYFGIQTPPILSGPIINGNKSFVFRCEVIYGSRDESQSIEVSWTFDGQQDQASSPLVISGSNRTIVLDGRHLQGHLNTRVGCQARLVYPDSNISTRFITSNTYFVGVKVQPSPLTVSEIDFEKYITLVSTIPILCDDQSVDCCLTFKLNMNETSVVSLINSCDHKICYSDWDALSESASVKIGIIPTRNVLVRGSNNVFVSFEVIAPAGHGSYLDIFQNYKPGRLQINVKDEIAFKCSFTGDPHILGFDLSGGYNLFLSGDFVAYTAPGRDFMIQVRTVPCVRVACVCGIAVRERNNVIKVDKCSPNSGLAMVSIAYELSPGTVVQSSTDGNRFGIYLPSGSEVRIESGGLNVYISIPAFDKGQGRGICGTNDGIQDNDFTYPNGTVGRGCGGGCLPNAFFESWRVTQNSSLFEVVPDPVNATNSSYGSTTQYCSCHENSNGSSSVICSARQHIQRTNTACPNCPDITDILVPSYVVGVGWVRPGANRPDPPFVHPHIPPVDSNKHWPTDDGITESQARDMCTQAMEKSQLYRQCQNLPSHLPTSIMSDCLTDILYGGTTQFLDDITSSFTSQCQLLLAENSDNYVTNADGDQVMKPELLDHICPMECFTHGQCGPQGRCQCQDGWEGETCLIETGKGPQLMEIQGGNVCDTKDRSCENIHIEVNNINLSDKLQCVVQEVEVHSNNSVGARILTTAVFLTPHVITCSLSALSLSTKKYNISATKDGILFGNELSVRVYDGTCLNCDIAGCEEKRTACHISNVCYKNGETQENDPNKVCDVGKNIFDWTLKHAPYTTGDPNLSTQGLTTASTSTSTAAPTAAPPPVATPEPVYPTRPPQETMKPCHFCFGG
ncbi:hypothetical protein BsWGS_03927 [Bradybaena similaris]